MNKTAIYDLEIKAMTASIIRDITADRWRPDYVVGITRGGLVPPLMISHYLQVPMETLKVSLRDGGECETNCWMSEDAFGYASSDLVELGSDHIAKNILIVDDINDSGATLDWIRKDWMSTCCPDDPKWANQIWGHNVRFAVLINNESSEFTDVTYSGRTINRLDDDSWFVFPWEAWWQL